MSSPGSISYGSPTHFDNEEDFQSQYGPGYQHSDDDDSLRDDADELPESSFNGGKGVRYSAIVIEAYPTLSSGQKRRQNAAKPKKVAPTFFVSEHQHFGLFLSELEDSVKIFGNSSEIWDSKVVAGKFRSKKYSLTWSMRGKSGALTQVADYQDMITQITGRGEVRLTVEELDVPFADIANIDEDRNMDEVGSRKKITSRAD
ncbi:hypothetical protein F5880DRAFT_1603409 [Lentinula raphanica]|nr:hypothetical protein F5880DRAFT_1603409 [Lentinula raphanica]